MEMIETHILVVSTLLENKTGITKNTEKQFFPN